jgi:hypothetical protein
MAIGSEDCGNGKEGCGVGEFDQVGQGREPRAGLGRDVVRRLTEAVDQEGEVGVGGVDGIRGPHRVAERLPRQVRDAHRAAGPRCGSTPTDPSGLYGRSGARPGTDDTATRGGLGDERRLRAIDDVG